MPPAGSKRKRRAPVLGAGAEGSADGGADGDCGREEGRASGLNPSVVKQFLGMLQRPDRLGPDFFTDVERQQWDEWLDAVPGGAADSMDAKSLLPVKMPLKCLPRPEAGSSSIGGAPTSQAEIITYANAGGRQFRAADRRRQYASKRALVAADVPKDSTVAIWCDPEAATQPGYRTPFWVGDIMDCVSDAASGELEKVTIHFRMPEGAGGLFCDDVKKPWNLVCHAQHAYTLRCERGVACRAAAQKADSSTARFTYTCEAAEIMETKLEFNQSGTLKAATKKRLAESAPEKGSWNVQLGLDALE